MKPYTSLSFPGTCKEAFETYARITGGKVTMVLTWAETPMKDNLPAEIGGTVAHARIEIGGVTIIGSDPPADRYEKSHGMCVMLIVDNAEEAERVFAELSVGGEVNMPLEKTFFAERFGGLRDKFGIPWMIGCIPEMEM